MIGLKLMAIAGYNPDKAPETFRRLGAMEVGGKMAGLAGSDTARMVLQVGVPGRGLHPDIPQLFASGELCANACDVLATGHYRGKHQGGEVCRPS